MSVIILKKSKPEERVDIATQNNARRAENHLTMWSGEDVWALYLAFFG